MDSHPSLGRCGVTARRGIWQVRAIALMLACGLWVGGGKARGQTNASFAELLLKAQGGDDNAKYHVGRAHMHGHYLGVAVATNYTEAARWIVPLAEKGHPRALNSLGAMHENGYGVPTNYVKAREWYLKAANAGDYRAAHNLGELLREGRGGAVAEEEGLKWEAIGTARLRELVAKGGDAEDHYNMGRAFRWSQGMERSDPVEAFKWMLKSGEGGYWAAEFSLAQSFYYGRNPATVNRTEAVRWARLAAGKGYHLAQSWLGWVLAFGDESLRDEGEAVKWLSVAAERGHSSAQHNLAILYEQGRGAPKDLAQAYTWFRKAAEQGHYIADYSVGEALRYGRGVDKDVDGAVNWYRRSANQGYDRAQYRLGELHEQGTGVKKDIIEAYKWYSLSAEQARKLGNAKRNALAKKLKPEQLSEAEKRIRQFKVAP